MKPQVSNTIPREALATQLSECFALVTARSIERFKESLRNGHRAVFPADHFQIPMQLRHD